MNLRRGLLRVWIVLSVAWVTGGLAMAWTDGQSIYPSDYIYRPSTDSFEAYGYEERDGLRTLTQQGMLVSVDFPDQSNLLIHREISTESLSKRFWKEREGKRSENVRKTFQEYWPGIFLPPACILMLGFVIAWIVSGFRRDPA